MGDKLTLPARAIYDSGITRVKPGQTVDGVEATWLNGSIATLMFYDGTELLFTLTFTWNPDGTFNKMVRT